MNTIKSFSDFDINEAAKDNVYIVRAGNDTRDRYVKGTLEDLIGYFSYTLEIGNSWKKSIQKEPKNIKSFVKNLQASYEQKEAAIYNRTLVDLVTEIPADAKYVSDLTANKKPVEAKPEDKGDHLLSEPSARQKAIAKAREEKGQEVTPTTNEAKKSGIKVTVPTESKTWVCTIEWGKYQNNDRTAMTLIDKHGDPCFVATVNLPDQKLADDEVFIKNYSENAGVLDALEAAGVVKATGKTVSTGHVEIPVAKLLVKPE